MKRSKKYNEAAAKVDQKILYTPGQAVKLAKETSTTKYDATVEVALLLGVDPKKAQLTCHTEPVRQPAFLYSQVASAQKRHALLVLTLLAQMN
jgi:hypothetical protein